MLGRIYVSSLTHGDLRRIWKLITVHFPKYREHLMADYIPSVEWTYELAEIELP